MVSKIMFSSVTDDWATPQKFFDALNEEFLFCVDVCATPENAKCELFYTKEQNGLTQEWGGVVWCNPPYGREVGHWVKKAHDSFSCGSAEIVVMLLPARTDTRWFHDYIYEKAEVRFVKGRLKFGAATNCAPFPSMVVVYRQNRGV